MKKYWKTLNIRHRRKMEGVIFKINPDMYIIRYFYKNFPSCCNYEKCKFHNKRMHCKLKISLEEKGYIYKEIETIYNDRCLLSFKNDKAFYAETIMNNISSSIGGDNEIL